MPLFPADALNPGVRPREVFGWAMYDFANSGYTTVVLTAVFAAYFVGGVAGGAPWATFAWTAALSVSYAIVMLSMPTLGALAAASASPWWRLSTLLAPRPSSRRPPSTMTLRFLPRLAVAWARQWLVSTLPIYLHHTA